MGGEALHRHDAAPGDAAGELGPIGAKQALADLRVNAVCSDDERRTHRFASLEADFDVLVGLDDVDAAPSKVNCIRFQACNRFRKNSVQVRAVEQNMRRTVTPSGGRTEFVPSPGLASAPVPNFLPR